MMHSFIYVSVLGVLLHLSGAEVHDHDHEDPFHELIELTSSAAGDETMNITGLEAILSTLGQRLPEISMCFTVENLNEILKINLNDQNAKIGEELFHNISTILVYFATEENCTIKDIQTAKDALWHADENPTEVVEEIVEKLRKVDYDPATSTHACFNGHTLVDGETNPEPEEIFAKIVLNLYEGVCILPEAEYFRDELLEYLNATGNIISKEALDNLMKKLGIGKQESGEIKEEEDHGDDHDDGHDHRRRRRDAHDHDSHSEDHEHEHEPRCYTSEDLLAVFEVGKNLTFDEAMKVCPALLHQLATDSCHVTEKLEANNETQNTTSHHYTQAMVYGYGTAAVAIISLLALGGMIFFPVLESRRYIMAMQFMVALGVSTMACDALLHIIPYILGIHVHSEEEGHDHEEEEDITFVWRMSVVALGIYLFYFFENAMAVWHQKKKLKESNDPSDIYENRHTHGHHDHSHQHTVTSFTSVADNHAKIHENDKDEKRDGKSVDDLIGDKNIVCCGLTSVCVMIFIGDILHNFGDGIAIGVSFASSWTSGVGTSLAIFCHELPHEFGDFAIYLKNGTGKWKAIFMNFIAACFAFIGLYLGITVAQNDEARQWLMSAIAGMFLYISLVEVLHEMVMEKTDQPYMQFFLQNLGLLVGWAILLLIAIYEEDIESSITA